MLCTLVMSNGKDHENASIPGDNMEAVRKWFNGGEKQGETLRQFINLGTKAVININHIVSVVPDED